MGDAGFQPGLFDVLQHGEGDFQGWTTSDQQRRGCSLAGSTRFHDIRGMGGISVRNEARSGASGSRRVVGLIACTTRNYKYLNVSSSTNQTTAGMWMQVIGS